MSEREYVATIKAELNVLKDIEKTIKWVHITTRSVEERHSLMDLTSEEAAALLSVLRRGLAELRRRELTVMKGIAHLELERAVLDKDEMTALEK